MRVHTKSRHFY